MEPPYPEAIGRQLEQMMPAGVPPIALFRTFVKHLPMAEAMGGWGTYELSRRLSLSMRIASWSSTGPVPAVVANTSGACTWPSSPTGWD